MPRIEIIEPKRNKGDASATLDVCRTCKDKFEEQEPVSVEVLNEVLETSGIELDENCTVGSIDVEHPPYEDDITDCDCCGDELTQRDN